MKSGTAKSMSPPAFASHLPPPITFLLLLLTLATISPVQLASAGSGSSSDNNPEPANSHSPHVLERFVDVRKLIRDTLDIFRSYPAPDSLVRGTTNLAASIARPSPVPLPIAPSQMNDPHAAMGRQPLPNAGGQQAAGSLGRVVAQPSQHDMERLLHLPVEILNQLAEDAGYAEPAGESSPLSPPSANRRSSSSDFHPSSNIGSFSIADARPQGTPESRGESGSGRQEAEAASMSMSGFSTTSTTEGTPIVAAGKPKVLMRGVRRGGKLVQIPVMAVPQPNGHVIYVPFERLTDLSEALAKLVSTGQISSNELLNQLSGSAQQQQRTSPPPPSSKRGKSSQQLAADIPSPPPLPYLPVYQSYLNNYSQLLNNNSRLGGMVVDASAVAQSTAPPLTIRQAERAPPLPSPSDPHHLILGGGGGSGGIGNDGHAPAGSESVDGVPVPDSAQSSPQLGNAGFMMETPPPKRLIATEGNAFVQEVDEEGQGKAAAASANKQRNMEKQMAMRKPDTPPTMHQAMGNAEEGSGPEKMTPMNEAQVPAGQAEKSDHHDRQERQPPRQQQKTTPQTNVKEITAEEGEPGIGEEITLNGRKYRLIGPSSGAGKKDQEHDSNDSPHYEDRIEEMAEKKSSAAIDRAIIPHVSSQPTFVPKQGPIRLSPSAAMQLDYMNMPSGVQMVNSGAFAGRGTKGLPLLRRREISHSSSSASKMADRPSSSQAASRRYTLDELDAIYASTKKQAESESEQRGNGGEYAVDEKEKSPEPISRRKSRGEVVDKAPEEGWRQLEAEKLKRLRRLEKLRGHYLKKNYGEYAKSTRGNGDKSTAAIKLPPSMANSIDPVILMVPIRRYKPLQRQQSAIIAPVSPNSNNIPSSSSKSAATEKIEKSANVNNAVEPVMCQRIRLLARQFGQMDAADFIRRNCPIIEQHYPLEFICAIDAREYTNKC